MLQAFTGTMALLTISLASRKVSGRHPAGLEVAQLQDEKHPPRIHDLRHTFATRALEQCSTRREAVARHFVALATLPGPH